MALDRLTKITGPGIKTDTNWEGNNANFTGVTTTASILVTSSYVNVPAIETLPVKVPSTAVTFPEKDPSTAETFPEKDPPVAVTIPVDLIL